MWRPRSAPSRMASVEAPQWYEAIVDLGLIRASARADLQFQPAFRQAHAPHQRQGFGLAAHARCLRFGWCGRAVAKRVLPALVMHVATRLTRCPPNML